MLEVTKEAAVMLTSDGVRLDADVYRPAGAGPFPVLLMRQPYGRSIASTVVYAHPAWYAAHGYLVVIQDVRGRGSSEGEFALFATEIEDGYETVNWAANLPGSNGQVGMYGFSYQGMTQLYAAAAQPAALKTICPAMIGYDLYSDWAYEGGAFCLQANLGWAIQLAAETARRKGDEVAHRDLFMAARNLSFDAAVPARSPLLETLAPDSFYHEWLAHPAPGPYWDTFSPKTYLQVIDLPMLHIGGWFDTFLRGTLHLYQDLAARSQFRQQLIVGPWTHLPWGRKIGAVDCGAAATSFCDRLQLRWFDHFLKGIDTGLLTEPPVQLFELGSNLWRSFPQFPTHPPTSYFLVSDGLASIDQNAELRIQNSATQNLPDLLVHDPWRPVAALGGHAISPSGRFDRSSLDCRSDILTYTSEPLSADLHLAGEITATLYCTADQPSFDLCAILSEVQPNGSVYNLAQGYMRVEPGQTTLPVTIVLQAICACIREGHALRLSLSAACFPAYPVNAGTGAPPGATRLIDQQIITIAVYSGGDRASHLALPVCPDA